MRFGVFKMVFIMGLALFLLGTLTASAEEEAAQIICLKGRVEVQHTGEDAWVAAEEDMVLIEKDRIKTFPDSEVEIAIDLTLKNIIKLEPDTEITLEVLKARRVYMPEGKVLSVIESLPSGSSFEVRTPTAVAGVAGSGLSVDTDGKKTDAGCFEDKIYVRGINKDGTLMDKMDISEGFKRIIEQFGMPGGPLALTDLERKQWLWFREELRRHLDRFKEKDLEGGAAAGGGQGRQERQDRAERVQERQGKRLDETKENIFDLRESDRREKTERRESTTSNQTDRNYSIGQ